VASSAIEWITVVTTVPAPTNPARWDPSLLVRIAALPGSAAGGLGREDATEPFIPSGQLSQDTAGNPLGPILVVDDDRSILMTVHEILDMEGYPVVAVSDGAEALRRAEEVRPSLVLLDMRMPGMNGWEVAQHLRERGIAVPILVMTAAQDARLWAEQIGAAGFLSKPFDLDDLLAAVERLRPA
jgi:CheY-like chemotaxis protein